MQLKKTLFTAGFATSALFSLAADGLSPLLTGTFLKDLRRHMISNALLHISASHVQR